MLTLEAVELLKRELPEDVSVVCSLGRLAEVTFRHFPNQTLFLDCMGDLAPLACGVALGVRDFPVLALDSDGSHLFGVTSLPVIASLQSRLSNLLLIVFDNHIYESAGGLPSRACQVDWQQLGLAFGINILQADSLEALQTLIQGAFGGFRYIVADIRDKDNQPQATKSLDGIESRYLFIRHLERTTGSRLLHPAVKS